MLDVVPPQHEGDEEEREVRHPRKARMITPSVFSNPKKPPASESKVVQVEWKLPARLRKPIREQLRKEREARRRRQAVVRFTRTPIHTRPVFKFDSSSSPERRVQKPSRRVFNRGAEHHTGDTYRQNRPRLQMTPPPYGAMRPRAKATPQPRPTHAPGVKMRRTSISLTSPQVTTKPRPKQSGLPNVLQGERDIPYKWSSASKQNKPKLVDTVPKELPQPEPKASSFREPKRLSIPFTLNFWPKFLSGSRQGDVSSSTSKKKVPKLKLKDNSTNIILLLLGSAVMAGGLWQLQSFGRSIASLGAMQGHVQGALSEVVAAQAALAETDVKASEEAFMEAESLLQQTQAELDTSLATSKDILRYIDITGTVRSGEELLQAAQSLTQAGQHVSRAMAPFLEAKVMSDENEENQSGLVYAITASQSDFEQAAAKLKTAEESLAHVDSPFLPEEIEAHVATLKTSVPRARKLVETFLNENSTLLHILGAERDRQYLILFANNHELRPVGGFIGTIGLVNVDRGRVENIDVQSVYNPDGQLREFIEPPLPLTPVTDRWYLRDANWFVDYEVSARKIANFFEKEGGPTVDGVILLTPDVIKRLLQVTGPIKVEGYDVELTSENFVQATQAEVTYDYNKELNRPKQFLADLTPVLLNRLFGTENSNSEEGVSKLQVMAALGTALHYKEAVIYVRDEEVQQKVRDLHWAGGYPENAPGFLSINNANIGGHKSDQFIDQEIDYRVEVREDGSADVVLTMRRSHRGPQEKSDYPYPEGEDPSAKANVIYQRVLVPPGAELKEAQGFTPFSNVPTWVIPSDEIQTKPDPDVAMWQSSQTTHESGTMIGTEAGYTFFANWIVTHPGDTSVLMYRYELPTGYIDPLGFIDNAEQVSAYIAKQPGQMRTKVRVSMLLPTQYRFVHTSPADGVTREVPHELVYRGDLQHDVLVGGVFEKAR